MFDIDFVSPETLARIKLLFNLFCIASGLLLGVLLYRHFWMSKEERKAGFFDA